MKSKIKLRFILIGTISILLTAILIGIVFHKAYKVQHIDGLKATARFLASGYRHMQDVQELRSFDTDQFRITLISKDGQVLFESDHDLQRMGNHGDRIEIQEALESGEGESIRHSVTGDTALYYYALQLEDGNILRISMETDDFYSVFLKIFPIIAAAVLGVLLAAVLFSIVFTRKLVKPITEMAEHFDYIDEDEVYEELRPFVASMKEQQRKKNAVEKMKQDFTANVSHELKTPLTSISGYAEMIETGFAAEKDVKEFAGKIRHESGRLITLIGDIIKLSEVNETSIKKEFEPVDLYAVAAHTVEALSFHASKHNSTLQLRGEPCFVTGNKGLLEELIYNLCDNAIRYNKPQGSVTVSVLREDGKVTLRVKDTGIGIPEKYQERIFERFYRVDKSRSKETGGTGLGLAIVKHIAIQHSAAIFVESQEEKGTEIKVIFP